MKENQKQKLHNVSNQFIKTHSFHVNQLNGIKFIHEKSLLLATSDEVNADNNSGKNNTHTVQSSNQAVQTDEFVEPTDKQDPVNEAINKLRQILNRRNSLNNHHHRRNDEQTASVSVCSRNSSIESNQTESDAILSAFHVMSLAEEDDKENEQPVQAEKPWYEGVVIKPVAFKYTSRRSSQN